MNDFLISLSHRASSMYGKRSFIWSLKEDEECDYDHTMMDNPSAQGSEKGDCSVDEDNSNMYKDVS